MKVPYTFVATTLLFTALQVVSAMAGSPAPALSTPTLAPLLEKVRPAVVTVHVIGQRYQETELTPGADTNKPPTQYFKSGGSGVIFDAERGLIGTNNHVVKDAISIKVGLHDGRITTARLVGVDVATDIAILKIELPNLTALTVGNSDNLKVGDFVVAVGSPFGLEGTATSGIVSGLMRSDVGYEIFESFIQIDAAVNPGNSGGALVNLQGELIGVNTAIAGGRNIGIGFAIPINMAKRIGRQIVLHGYMPRGALGISASDVSMEMAQNLKLPSLRGAAVTGVVPASPAEKAGIRVGDIIVAIAGEQIRTHSDYMARVGSTALGESLEIDLMSEAGPRTVAVTVSEIKVQPAPVRVPSEVKGIGGLELSSIEPGSPYYGRLRGAVVVGVAAEGSADGSPFKVDDVITAIDQESIRDADEILRIVRSHSQVDRVQLNRQGVPYWVRIRRPASN
ncbi:MAG TPA: trypsin-like peptidase domain-containing protein [Hyphomicrobiaceae bacterium]|nr:trypsin-like peptidase domain-containing protein [Hyphomicrobiaceae bacterium]